MPIRVGVLSVVMLAIAAPVSAAGWTDPVTLSLLAPSKEVFVRDIATRGESVAVAWEERPFTGNRAVYLRWSTDSGDTWKPRERLSTRRQLEVRVDLCGGALWATSRIEATGGWVIDLDRRGLSSGSTSTTPVTGVGDVRGPDIACAGRRLAIAWFQKVAGVWKVRLQARGVTGGLRTYSTTLGKGSPSRGLAVAGTADRLYVAWYQGKALKLRRFAIGGGTQAPVSSLGTGIVGGADDGFRLRMGAAGDRVGLAYTRRGDTYGRVSSDQAISFHPHRRLVSAAFEIGTEASHVDVRGSAVIVTASVSTVGTGWGYLYRTTNEGSSWSEVPGSLRTGGAMVAAFGTRNGAIRIMEAWDSSYVSLYQARVRFRRQK
jgi:hypothetical protein